MYRKKRKRNRLPAVVAAVALLSMGICIFFITRDREAAPVLTNLSTVRQTPVIDAGHGGEDGGAVSPEGDKEAPLNLAIALKTDLIMRFYGITPVMTRSEDISIHDNTAVTLKEKKYSDIRNRIDIVNNIDNAVLLSIHQNSFEQGKYFGAQTFHDGNPQSAELAEIMQFNICTLLDTKNTRNARKIDDSIILMREVQRPAILLECGFLTNTAELHKLITDEYQTQLAAVIAASFMQWAGEN